MRYTLEETEMPDGTTFTKTAVVRALSRDVLAVAVNRAEGAWKAYCGAVPGRNHDHEWPEIFKQGTDLGERVALAVFPEFTGTPYAR